MILIEIGTVEVDILDTDVLGSRKQTVVCHKLKLCSSKHEY